MKVLTGMFSHETNTFSNLPTGLEQFKQRHFLEGAAIEGAFGDTRSSLGGFIDVARRRGAELVYTVAASATPGGKVTDDVFELVWENVCSALDEHPDVTGVLLALHGAMVVESDDDGEGALLERLRSRVGAEVPIVATLDLHANLTPRMVGNADVLIGYKTYPHVDGWERAVEAAELLLEMAAGKVRPTMPMAKPPLAPTCPGQLTERTPARDFVDRLVELEASPGVLSASMLEGFPYADIEEMGMGFLVVTDGDRALAQRQADALAEAAWARRYEFVADLLDVPEAVEEAMALSAGGHPVVLADMSDNPGGGAAGDSVAILAEFTRRGATGVAVSTVYDPEVVALAHEAGVGATLRTRLGGKTDDLHGPSLSIEGRVRSLSDGRFVYKGRMNTGVRSTLGRAAVVEVAGNLVIVNEYRRQSIDPEILRSQDIEPRECRFIVLKSAVHYRSNFSELAHAIVEVTGPGVCSARLSDFHFEHVRRPLFPLDDVPG